MTNIYDDIQKKVIQDKLAGFTVNLGGVGCRLIEDIGGHVNCRLDEENEYAIWDFRSNKVVGIWSQFGVVSDMEFFVIYGLKPIETQGDH